MGDMADYYDEGEPMEVIPWGEAEALYGRLKMDKGYGARRVNVSMLRQGSIWIDKNAKVWAIEDMTDEHLDGLMKWLELWWDKEIRARMEAKYRGVAPIRWQNTELGVALCKEATNRVRSLEHSFEDWLVEFFTKRQMTSYINNGSGRRTLAHALVRDMLASGYKLEKK